jgi:hypothetical protein
MRMGFRESTGQWESAEKLAICCSSCWQNRQQCCCYNMPRSGGEADKLGNRYEGIWIADSLLDVVDGVAVSITVEPFDEIESTGIEFIKELPDGSKEYHSVKRQTQRNVWSLAELAAVGKTGRGILGDLAAKLRGDKTISVFVSATTANTLNELCERAERSESSAAFEEQLKTAADLRREFDLRILPVFQQNFESAYNGLCRWRVSGGPERDLIRRIEQRIRKDIYRPDGATFEPVTVRLLLGELVYGSFGQPIHDEQIRQWLNQNGFAERDWTRDTTTSQRVQERIASYISHVEAELVNPPVERAEAKKAFEALRTQGKRRVVILGAAGLGKSCATAQTIRRLVEAGIACLPVRLDVQVQALTARQLGEALDLRESPAVVLAGIANGGDSVLILDQLDALSFASGRNQQLWDAFEELLLEAERYPTMKVLLVCRLFDSEHDPRIRRILANKDRTESIPLKPLELDQVWHVLRQNGIDPTPIASPSLELLQLPLNLSLYLQGEPKSRPLTFSEHDLLERYWDHKRRLFANDVQWFAAIERLADWLSKKQTLSAPVHIFRELQQDAERLSTLHVFAHEGNQVRFFHESFFDYCWARIFVSRGNRLLDFLLENEQHLFRRAQVRQVLNYERGAARDDYLRDLEDLLANPKIRYHIEKLTLDWLRDLPDPTDKEWAIVEANYPGGLPRNLGSDVLWRSVPWFDLLLKLGAWSRWLDSSEADVVSRAVWLLSMKEIMRVRSVEIAALLAPYARGEKPWRPEFLGIFQFGEVHHSREMFDLLLTVTRRGYFKTLPARHWINFHDLPEANASYAAEFLDVLVEVLEDRERDAVENRFGVRPDFILKTASRDPGSFLRAMIPRLLAELRKEGAQPGEGLFGKLSWRMLRGAEAYDIRSALEIGVSNALEKLVVEDPEKFDELTRDLEPIHHPTAAMLLLSSWAENGKRYCNRIVQYFLADQEWLDLGYWAVGSGNPTAAVARAAIRAAAPYCSKENHDVLELMILKIAPEREKEDPKRRGYTSMLFLECLPKDRISPVASKRLNELFRRFPRADLSMPSGLGLAASFVPPPIAREAIPKMTDDNWLSAMRHYTTDGSETYERYKRGGIFQLTGELRRAAQIEKARFAQLAVHMDAKIPRSYFEAILSGITEEKNQQGTDDKLPASALEPLNVELIVAVIERIHSLTPRTSGKEISWAIRKIAERKAPTSGLRIAAHYALNDPDPEKETWRDRVGTSQTWGGDPHFQGMNSTRGAAAEAIASFLFADPKKYADAESTIVALIHDRSIAVRSCVVLILLAMLNFDRHTAVSLFLDLVKDADDVLGTLYVDQFLHYATYDHYATLRPLMLRMLKFENEQSREFAARQITVASFHEPLAKEDLAQVFAGDAICRRAAAGVFSKNLGQARVAQTCREHLPKFFDDSDKEVRAAAADCFREITTEKLKDEEDLMNRFIESPACPENNHDLVSALENSVGTLPNVICRLPERLIADHKSHHAGAHIEARTWTYHLPALITRLYDQTPDPATKARCLDIIDGMLELGFSEIESELQKVER